MSKTPKKPDDEVRYDAEQEYTKDGETFTAEQEGEGAVTVTDAEGVTEDMPLGEFQHDYTLAKTIGALKITSRGDGTVIIEGANIDAPDGQHLEVCFKGRVYHASIGVSGSFIAFVPEFEGEVEVFTAGDPRVLVAKGVA